MRRVACVRAAAPESAARAAHLRPATAPPSHRDYNEWNAAAQAQERSYARAVLEAEALEETGQLSYMDSDTFKKRQAERLRSLTETMTA